MTLRGREFLEALTGTHENYTERHWLPMHIYCSEKIMLLIPQMQLISQCFWLSFTRYLHPLFLAVTIASLFRTLLPFPWDNFNILVFLLIPLYSRTMLTEPEQDLSWKSSQSNRKSNMDVDNFNKNVLGIIIEIHVRDWVTFLNGNT